MRRPSLLALALVAVAGAGLCDELSGADKLRVVYSNQFAWTRDGLPLVTVRIAEGRSEVVLSGAGLRLQPDGDGGAELRSGSTWHVRVVDGRPGKVRWHVVVGHVRPGDEQLPSLLSTWRQRGFQPRTFEVGAVFGVKGEVLDSRKILVTVAPQDDEAAARSSAAALGQKWAVEAGVHPELAERPRGTVEAEDERGTVVRNDAILWFAPGPSGLVAVKDVDKEGGGREDRRYFGKLYVTVDGKGKLAVVNAVPEDKLLAGLVPAEMLASSPPEALKAQAVAARNQLLAKLGTRHLTDPYRLCATQHCQVYAGAGREDERATQAVQATAGELLVKPDGALVDTVYSASCGGHTEDNDRAFAGAPDPTLRGRLDGDARARAALAAFERIDDAAIKSWLGGTPTGDAAPFCARPREARANFRWTAKVDPQKVAERAGVGTLTDVRVLERGVSGRVTRLQLVGDRGARELKGELEVRRALLGLKSAMFVLTLGREGGRISSIDVAGGGHGHGVGMCQVGAVGMAEAGHSYREILEHYYSQARIQKMY